MRKTGGSHPWGVIDNGSTSHHELGTLPRMDTPPPADDDLTIAEAAALLGKSAKTVRRYFHTGRLPSRYRETPHGMQLIVSRVAIEEMGRVGPLDKITRSPQVPQITGVLSTLEGMQSALQSTQDALQRLEAGQRVLMSRIEVLETENLRLREQIALPSSQPAAAPRPDPVEDLRAKVDELTQQLQTQPDAVIPRPWWQRWRRG